ncbi:Threonylcarbamoyladenosine tRNA methylthiotransferase MtaB [Clostridium sp. N3C]|uniref:tRNA (N(6)-L-threonylcarbamoyladenosine(37)-C(2))- methylthiotransferase MtaB n=1 Tax=Clostridium sp. N3C TaxID=1776758 RepID=UPI00092DFB95|nr:tRNA (N(6)-L-threonylcarbamoyladenosine(37)-C(2))-methylthiotransferase MtaB [Clostridium sp. N3C]SCN21776.1 Threonylcarbamoyladenosine tRNA methylthiotransferase MtaB [Clostridium sp. N3C]
MKVAFATLGCRVNQYESEAMAEKFIKDGYQVVKFDDVADVYVINTCTVTNMGDKKSRQMIGRARRLNNDAVIAVVGCYSQVAPEEVSSIEGVDVVLGSRNKGDIVYWVNRARDEKSKIVQVKDVLRNKVFEDLSIETYQDRTRAFLKIQDGCNRFCAYCLIPYARGSVCSKNPEKVIEEVKELASHGFKEIILSGIHIASYGVDLDGNITLVDILEKINEIPGIERIRIGSIDPTFFTEGVMDRISKLEKLCPHFHLSMQSGCNTTLKRMNRRYTAEEYLNIVTELRRRIPDVSITTDVIVGFPGETEEEFEETYNFLKNIKLSKTHVFKYSPRKGTAAAKLKDDITPAEKERRSSELISLNNENERNFIENFIGKEMGVLYEQKSSKGEGYYEGYTPNYIKVVTAFENDEVVGKIIKTKLVKVEEEFAYGELVEL